MSIYTGRDSVYAQRHGRYCPGPGVDVRTARCILKMIDAELRRGWTYDERGRRIRMTPALAKKRALYLIALARRHHGPEEARRVEELVRRWLARRRAAAV